MSQSESDRKRSRKPSDEPSNIGQAAGRLRELILRGEFKAGERISELPLVALLGMSRTPIRLALERLSHEGLLEPNPTGGFVVKGFTLDDLWDSIEVRGTLEGLAARLAAERLSDPSELDALCKIQEAMDRVPGNHSPEFMSTYLDLNDAFHAEILRLSKSSILRGAVEKLFRLPFASPSALVPPPLKKPDAPRKFQIGNEHHHLLIDAIGNRHASFAQHLALEHSQLTRAYFEAAIKYNEITIGIPGGGLITISDKPSIHNE